MGSDHAQDLQALWEEEAALTPRPPGLRPWVSLSPQGNQVKHLLPAAVTGRGGGSVGAPDVLPRSAFLSGVKNS